MFELSTDVKGLDQFRDLLIDHADNMLTHQTPKSVTDMYHIGVDNLRAKLTQGGRILALTFLSASSGTIYCRKVASFCEIV